jgi:hypothetical protein
MCKRARASENNSSQGLEKSLLFTGYKLQLLHAIRPGDTRKRQNLAADMLNEIDNDELF